MSDPDSSTIAADSSVSLVARQTINASPERLFAAWTQPGQLLSWWGPENVTCIDAQVDLRVGGRYRLGNLFPDGKLVWIEGEFEIVEPPFRLAYTWRTGSPGVTIERVTVSFVPRAGLTEVIVVHERIPDAVTRDHHAAGWRGCLEGLRAYLRNTTRFPV